MGGGIIYELFRGEVAKVKKMWRSSHGEKLTNKKIANMAGLTESTVVAFMAGLRESERTANAIANALKIER